MIEQEVYKRIDDAISSGRWVEGLLFHATCEDIVGALRPGDYDNVLWTSDNPLLAQQYIPASGGSTLFAKLSSWELGQPVRPSTSDPWFTLAKIITGVVDDDMDIQLTRDGSVASYRIPPGWITYGDCEEYLSSQLGYDTSKNNWVKSQFRSGTETFLPADYLMPGKLFVTLNDGIRFKDLRTSSEADLMSPEYHNLGGFARANEDGYDGIIINDHAQTTHFGNLGHVSYGLLPNALANREWVEIDATRFELTDIDQLRDVGEAVRRWHQDFSPGSRLCL